MRSRVRPFGIIVTGIRFFWTGRSGYVNKRQQAHCPQRKHLRQPSRPFHQRDMIRGYSPAQHVLGQAPAPDETGRIEVGGLSWWESVRKAEKAHAEWKMRLRTRGLEGFWIINQESSCSFGGNRTHLRTVKASTRQDLSNLNEEEQ